LPLLSFRIGSLKIIQKSQGRGWKQRSEERERKEEDRQRVLSIRHLIFGFAVKKGVLRIQGVWK
jgi:hypothetical protein